MRFLLTIDTEADNQWDHGRELTVENIRFVPRFQELCNKFFIRPVYLVTSEVCEDPFAREIFSDYSLKGQAEIGAHLHPWTTPPFLDKDGYRYNDPSHPFASELPVDLLNEKIKNLTSQIESSFGIKPASFRSGRYGFNKTVAEILSENAYLVDSSVTPYTDWSSTKGITKGSGGPNFIDFTPFPFRYRFNDNSLVEIPITAIPTRFPLNKNHSLAVSYFSKVDRNYILRAFRKLFYKNQPLWLRPFEWMTIRLFEELLNEASRIGLPYLVMMFHSSELMPGCSKYRADEDAIERLYDLLEKLFVLLADRKISSVTLSEAAKKINL